MDCDIRVLLGEDLKQVQELDSKSWFEVAFFLEDCSDDEESYAVGAYTDGKLIGYCSFGGAEDYSHLVEYEYDSICLSDLFVLDYYREFGIGKAIVDFVLQKCRGKKIFLTILEDDLIPFYQRFGFEVINELGGIMYLDNRR